MKRFIFAVAAVLLALVSCEKDETKSIIGTWEAVTVDLVMEGINMSVDAKEMGMGMTFTFRENGTGTLVETAEGETITADFKYSVSDGILTIEPGEDMFLENKANIPFTIKGNKLTLVFDSETIMEENGAAITIISASANCFACSNSAKEKLPFFMFSVLFSRSLLSIGSNFVLYNSI